MRRATSFHPLAGIPVGADARRSRSASDADDSPDVRPSAARCARLALSERLTPTTLRTAAAAIAQRGARRAPPCVGAKPIGPRCFFIEEEGNYLHWTERQIELFVPKGFYSTWRRRNWAERQASGGDQGSCAIAMR